MTNKHTLCFAVALGVLLNLLSYSAFAEDKKAAREREALRRMQSQIQQLHQEKLAWEQERTLLKTAVAEVKKRELAVQNTATKSKTTEKQLEKDLLKARSESEDLLADIQTLRSTQTTLQQQLEQEKIRLKESNDQNIQANLEIRRLLNEQGRLETTAQAREREIASCEEKNLKLYQYNVELMKRYQKKGVIAALLQVEPFTQIQRVQMQAVLEEYSDKLDANRTRVSGSEDLEQ